MTIVTIYTKSNSQIVAQMVQKTYQEVADYIEGSKCIFVPIDKATVCIPRESIDYYIVQPYSKEAVEHIKKQAEEAKLSHAGSGKASNTVDGHRE